MSFGQGGPPWGSGGQHQDPYGQGGYGTGTGGYGQGPDAGAPGGYGDGRYRSGAGDRDTPDWAALADASAARMRRRRWTMIGGGALATVLVAGAVAMAIVSSTKDGEAVASGGSLPSAPTLPADTTAPEPSFSSVAPLPPPDPREFVSDRAKDTAPLTAESLFPGRKLTMGNGERAYTKGSTARTGSCATAATGALGAVLERNGCEQVFRATYRTGDLAVTVGVATFADEKTAKKVVQEAEGSITPMPGGGVPVFCKGGPVCRNTYNSYGRYAYFTITGHTSATSVTTQDTAAYQAGDDIGEFAFRQIVRRGEAQASAAATLPAQ
ncbi:hypothetical protein [Streptomyces sanyensis]|uniref:Uncharacterized protein n=1 Tax=Streptomyces sanyensis TaxID=568869 RepID=A0ABP9AMQ1_9ACTN